MMDDDELLLKIAALLELKEALPAVVNEKAIQNLYDVFEELCSITGGTNFEITRTIGKVSKYMGSVEITGDEIWFDDTKTFGYILRIMGAADVSAQTDGKVSIEFTANDIMKTVISKEEEK